MSAKRPKRHHHHTLILGLTAALAAPLALAQDAATRALIEQGQYWQSRGDSLRAIEAWEKLLRASPDQPEALYGMARALAQQQRPEEAQRYLEQLRRAHPDHRLVERLQQEINVQRNAAQVQQARNLARSGQAEQAMSSYRQALGEAEPTGPLALEYYQTLGGTSGGWDSARRGLERLARESPNDSKISLALAQHLTYREATRREGINQLARLSGDAEVGKAATDAWRKALAWTGTRASDIPLYQAFLRAHPGDEAVTARLREVEAAQRSARTQAVATRDPLRERSSEGFKALEEGDLEAAEAEFRSVLQARPQDGDALGGMGVLRLRQEEFSQARSYLERASRQGSPARWKQALASATYWSLVEEARAARDAGQLEAARPLLEQAVRTDPQEITAQNDLADVLAELGQLEAAEAGYRRVLARQADNPDAIRGLVGVLSQTGKAAEALQLVERLTPSQQEKVGALGRLRATQAMGLAKAAAARGDDNGARLALEDALLNDPANPWVRLDLARLYLKMGAISEARGVMDGLLVSNPNMPEALYASALLASESRDWAGALATLERIPEKNRTRDIAALQKRVWVHVQADAASLLAREGRVTQAQQILLQAEPFVGQDPELLGALALAWADAGDPNRALAMVRDMLARTPRPDVGLRLQYAATLLKTQQDVELAGILRQLQDTPMSAQDRRGYEDIRVGYILRQADALRTAGDLAGAYDTLAPLLAERPNDVEVIGALARMYADNGDNAQALGLYQRLLEKDPRNVKLLLAATSTATGARDYNYAESTVQVALQLAPQDPEVLTAAGRVYRAKGQASKAGQYFAAAIEAETRQRAQLMAATGQGGGTYAAPGAPGGNPFRRSAAQPLWGGRAPAAGIGGGALMPAAYAPAGYAQVGSSAWGAAPVAAGVPPGAQPFIPQPAGVARFPAPPAPPPATPANYYGSTAEPAAPAARSNTTSAARSAARPAARGAAPAPAPAAAPARSNAASAQRGSSANGGIPEPVTSVPAGASSALMTPAQARAMAAQPLAAPAYGQPAQAYVAPQSAYVPLQPGYAGAAPAALPASSTPSVWATAPLVPGGAPTRPRSALDDLAELQEGRTSMLSVGVVGRGRQGESGMSRLTDMQAPVEMKFPAGDGMMAVRVTPTGVGAGSPETSYGTLSRFGAGPATALDMPTRSPGSQNDGGVGIGIGYETAKLAVDVGTLPLGFRQNDVMGGVRYRLDLSDHISLTGDLSRRPVTDSVLSFAGARDARTGEKWGAVSANGARLDLTWDDGDFGAYAVGALHALQGHNVQSNSRVELGGGMYWRVHRTTDSIFTAGLNVTGMAYNKNLRYFTYGHGGYFSPQQFLAMSVPFDWAQRSGRLSYQIKGALGVQYFKEDASPYFPTNRARQAAAAQAASDAEAFGEVGTSATAIYPGQSKTGLGYNLGLAMEYQLHPQLFVGSHLALDNARNYRQFTGGLYVRYALQPYAGRQSLPVSPLKSPYAF
ncbi:cellulose synthase [Melaminivora suipulveris]|uniref:Cellulose synthase n=1 Tax=Melaminivora suipulveris TaxID=2109913 RepID=A0A2R3QCZ0_9BURK|nr:cellulose biosynthesis protein BcsC [Melaminivora suipulveris]AVO49527.1 cellulose synthase [Melaminivora suipulveris]